jgi:hypothetical protein
MKTAEEKVICKDCEEQFVINDTAFFWDTGTRRCFKCATIYLQQNTLNRDKVINIVRKWGHENFMIMTDGDEINLVDAICSLSLPTLSEGEITNNINERIDYVWFQHFDKMTDLMDYEGFKAAIKQLTKPKEE